MMSPAEKADDAYSNDALDDLMMGKWPYYEPEAYMAPSNVPTNWRKLLKGLDSVLAKHPDVLPKLEGALTAMTGSAEGLYCALATVLAYLDLRPFLSAQFVLDYSGVLDHARQRLPHIKDEAIASHPGWLGSTSETLWDRIELAAHRLKDDFHLSVA
jgi:hypothetical protein